MVYSASTPYQMTHENEDETGSDGHIRHKTHFGCSYLLNHLLMDIVKLAVGSKTQFLSFIPPIAI